MTDTPNNPQPDNQSAQVDEILCAAMGIDDDTERNTFIDNACSGNEALRDEVTQLLALQDKADDLFQERTASGIKASEIINTLADIPEFFESLKTPLPDDDEIGKQIGRYKLLQKIGEGGVGNVYLAEQTKPMRRQVALKIIKAGMDTRNVIARFEAERQALAMMEHPNIAHVLNAGETEAGRPFFAMEFVDGVKITTYCDENNLSIRQRLELFIPVCLAIQHAHQKGIIHRDIKPSNVLITKHDGAPSPVVIDFGIAKATGEDLLTDKTVNTSMGPIIGTPAYMSPEQTNLQQTDIDTRCDIYSLGVLLYELLISTPPFDHKELLKAGLDEMCRILREKDPPLPSKKFRDMDLKDQTLIAKNRGMDKHRLATTLSDDLDWITLKAMDKDRERRYESASELAMEIQRFLNHEPVTARPPSRLYRFQKLVRRNKVTFAYLTALCIAVFAGLGTSTWLLFRERDARISERQARDSEKELLDEADAREKIANAALMLSRGAHAEADRLMGSVELPTVEPSLEAANVFRTLAEWNITQGRWQSAANCFLKLQQANQLDKSNTTEEMTRDLLGAGPTLIIAGELDEYHRFVQETLVRFADTSDPSAAEQIIKNSLLVPADESTLRQLSPFARVVGQSIPTIDPKDFRNSFYVGWRTLALSLYEYRNGTYEQAVYWGERSLKLPDRNPPRVAMDHLVLAMAYAQQNQLTKARSELVAGRMLVNRKFRNGVDRILDLGSFQYGVWHDWVIAYLLLQEADELIADSSTGKH